MEPPNPHPEPTIVAQVVPESLPRPVPPRRGRRVLAWLVVLAGGGLLLGLLLLLVVVGIESLDSEARVQEKRVSGPSGAADKIAVITISGTIYDEEDGFVKRQIDQVRKDETVKAVVLRINSPGGTVTGSDFLYHHLRQLAEKRHLPLVASFGGLAASGGYYVAMAVGETPQSIYAEPTTWTGSIGVLIPHYNLSGLLTDWGVHDDSLASHRLKTMGSLTRPMTDEERKIFQGLIEDSFQRFKEIVRHGRPALDHNPQDLDAVATGQVFTAAQAKQHGLVDEIGFLEEAVGRAAELAGLQPDAYKVVKYKESATLYSLFAGQARAPSMDLKALLEAHAPRAHYLYTAVPPWLGR
jgi:protease IV